MTAACREAWLPSLSVDFEVLYYKNRYILRSVVCITTMIESQHATVANAPSSFRILIMGGFIGALSAACSSIGYSMLQIATILGLSIWNRVLYSTLRYVADEFPAVLVVAILMGGILIAFSIVPGFVAGTLIAWLLGGAYSAELLTAKRGLAIGAFVGAAFGMIVVIVTLLIEFVFPYHNQIDSQIALRESVNALEVIGFATLAGMWTGRHIRMHLSN